MAKCAEQEFEVTELVENKAQEALELLSNKSLVEAQRLAKLINAEQFFGNPVIQVTEDKISNEESRTEVNISKVELDKTIEYKIEDDNKLETEQRIAELQAGNNYRFDDMPKAKVPYNEFDYASVISNKMLLKEKQLQY